MHVITVVNEKGGEGKTLTSLLVAAGAAIRGARVLLIDGDTQGHCSSAFHMPKQGGLFNLLVEDMKWQDVLVQPPREQWLGNYSSSEAGTMWMLPSKHTTMVIPMLMKDAGLLRERLEQVETTFDIVVIDTAPQLGLLHTAFYLASTGLVHPARCEFFSLEGLGQTKRHISSLNTDRMKFGMDGVPLLGVVPNAYQKQHAVHEYALGLMKENFGEENVLAPLALRTAHREAAFHGKSIYAYAPGKEAELEAWAMVEAVLARLN
jgi:chromosome partitioning protein